MTTPLPPPPFCSFDFWKLGNIKGFLVVVAAVGGGGGGEGGEYMQSINCDVLQEVMG